MEKILNFIIYSFLGLFAIGSLLPFWMVLINSFATESSLIQDGFQLWPSEFGLGAYRFLLKGHQVLNSYGITLIVTIAGTAVALWVTAAFAYVLAHPKIKYNNLLSMMTYIPMVFGTGLVGFYLLIVNWLNLKDTVWALILPYLVNPFLAFIFVAFYRTLPYEINESATVDGANEWRIFFQIVRPIVTPVMVTVGLFYALQYWNDWWLGLLFIDKSEMYPLQILLRQLLGSADALKLSATYGISPPSTGIKLAMVIITIGPIIFAYPFIQKYFVKGLTIGAVKG
ncbi:carbohydrate ABC transporter permease [Cohnella terricola]|uniref:Carbohydrate ABC transporter permease n=1 Tax=Cohnella terricola TaxID=1289167 RepID=A0A559J7V5_9BACL|nr:carbohydrate ABC transporter permease [Cohnella terricola]TVX95926.1 carbohydrate ABC transporter permease [Cohnella terricola]